jgi:hypothetical protein
MRREDDPGQPQQLVVGRYGFNFEHVQSSATEAPFSQGGDERSFVYDGTPARVDEHRLFRHQTQFP